MEFDTVLSNDASSNNDPMRQQSLPMLHVVSVDIEIILEKTVPKSPGSNASQDWNNKQQNQDYGRDLNQYSPPTTVTQTFCVSYPVAQSNLIKTSKGLAESKQANWQFKQNSQPAWAGQTQAIQAVMLIAKSLATPVLMIDQTAKKALCFVTKPMTIHKTNYTKAHYSHYSYWCSR